MDIGNIYRKIKDVGKIKKLGPSFNPERDWKIIFVIAVLFFVAQVAFNGYIFWSVKEGNIFNSQTKIEDHIPEILVKQLEKNISFFESKKIRFDQIKQDGLKTVDPAR